MDCICKDRKKINLVLVSPMAPPAGGIGNWTKLIHKISETTGLVNIFQIKTNPKKYPFEKPSFITRVFNGIQNTNKTAKKLKHILKDNNYDVDAVHITSSASLALFRDVKILGICKKAGIKTVFHLRVGSFGNKDNVKGYQLSLLKRIAKLATYIVVLDEKTKQNLSIALKRDIKLIPNLINMGDPIVCQSTYDSKSNYIVYAGWIVKTKGIEELLTAWKQIDHNGCVLKLVGPANEDYLKYLKDNFDFKDVDYLGEKNHEETLKIMSKSRFFVLPSYTEGFPNVILEAMALKLPILASSVGAIPDMLNDSCGLLTEIDIEHLKNNMQLLINDSNLRINYSAKAFEKCKNAYSSEVVFQKYLELWQ